MAHRSRAALLRRTSQSAAASRALSVAFTSNCRMVVRWRVTFFIGRYRSRRMLSLKDRRGGLRIQRTYRLASTPRALRHLTLDRDTAALANYMRNKGGRNVE